MSLSFRCGARVAAVALTTTVVLVGGQVRSADAADSSPGRAGGCLREGSIFDFQCPVMPVPESPDRRPLHVQSTPHTAPSAWSRSRARHLDHAERSDAPVHADGHVVRHPVSHPVSHRAVPAQHPVEQARSTQAGPHTEQAFVHHPARTVTPAQPPASTPAAPATQPSVQSVTPAQRGGACRQPACRQPACRQPACRQPACRQPACRPTPACRQPACRQPAGSAARQAFGPERGSAATLGAGGQPACAAIHRANRAGRGARASAGRDAEHQSAGAAVHATDGSCTGGLAGPDRAAHTPDGASPRGGARARQAPPAPQRILNAGCLQLNRRANSAEESIGTRWTPQRAVAFGQP